LDGAPSFLSNPESPPIELDGTPSFLSNPEPPPANLLLAADEAPADCSKLLVELLTADDMDEAAVCARWLIELAGAWTTLDGID
jgi:hypothetical protein